MFIFDLLKSKTQIPAKTEALQGRAQELDPGLVHYVNRNPLKGPYPEGSAAVYFGLGCFWGAERLFWQMNGVWVTAVGYMGGHTENPTYQEVCSGRTGHTEAVLVVYNPDQCSLNALSLACFWEEHNPTQGMRQGNDIGTQYRSAIYTVDGEQHQLVAASHEAYQAALDGAGHSKITTEIASAGPFYFAEEYHQQYLAKNPGGYCGLSGTGVRCSV